ncbi:MAG: hypothetical protein Kow0058_18860 [Roseovarius sp.]
MRFKPIIAGVASALCICAAVPALAGQCGYDKCWGAVGFGPGGAWGWASGKPSQQAAISTVQRNCRGNCTQIKTFYNTCGVIAAGNMNGWGWGYSQSRAQAEKIALGFCRRNDTGCRVRAWACSF